MDDSTFGTRNKRGDWAPNEPLSYPPLFTWPPRPRALMKWLFGFGGYVLPWSLAYYLCSVAVWIFFTPSVEVMSSFGYRWVGQVLLRNALMVSLVYGIWHFVLYVKRCQGGLFKFNSRWPGSNDDAFVGKRQHLDNLLWTFLSGVPIWTAYEVFMLWCFASGRIAFLDWRTHPCWYAALLILIPLFHDLHFYCVHRLLHWPPMYRLVHSLHHNNVNPGPLSGLAMHPIEHILYFSGVLIHLFVPSHPTHLLFHLAMKGLGPAQSHAGFDRLAIGKAGIQTHGYQHYLHHKFFECNYSDGAIPLDRWFGSFHDGTPEAQTAMDRRFMQRAQKASQKKSKASR